MRRWRSSVPVLILVSLLMLLPTAALGILVAEARAAGFPPAIQLEGLIGAALALLGGIGAIWRLVLLFRRNRSPR